MKFKDGHGGWTQECRRMCGVRSHSVNNIDWVFSGAEKATIQRSAHSDFFQGPSYLDR